MDSSEPEQQQGGPGPKDLNWLEAVHRVNRLTAREREVFIWLAGGFTNEQLAAILGVAERTIRSHLGQIFDKLQVESRVTACLASFLYGQKTGVDADARPGSALQD